MKGAGSPRRRSGQCGILSRITGTEDHAPVSKFVTKQTYLFVDHLRLVGNFGLHRGGEPRVGTNRSSVLYVSDWPL